MSESVKTWRIQRVEALATYLRHIQNKLEAIVTKSIDKRKNSMVSHDDKGLLSCFQFMQLQIAQCDFLATVAGFYPELYSIAFELEFVEDAEIGKNNIFLKTVEVRETSVLTQMTDKEMLFLNVVIPQADLLLFYDNQVKYVSISDVI